MKKIKLKFVDINYDAIGNLIKWLSEIYDVELTTNNPDYIIHSCFGHEVLKYKGIRIGFYGENIQPDFNISDYAMGFGHLEYGDRYKRIPLYRWYFSDYDSLFSDDRTLIKNNGTAILANKTDFCSVVYSNKLRGSYFEELLNGLNSYKTVKSGGRIDNNIGGPVEDKISFIGGTKFHIASENSSTPGYVTEKLLHAFTAKTLPIYWGAPDVSFDFNEEAFINTNNFKSISELVEYVKFLDNNDAEYIKMIEKPCFKDGIEPTFLEKKIILNWLKNIFDQPIEKAFRRNLHFWGERYEKELQVAFHKPHIQSIKNIYKLLKK